MTELRPWTLDTKTENGTRIRVKRCCESCGQPLGDATMEELDAAIVGPLPPVAEECGCALAAEPRAEAWPDRFERADENGTSAMWGDPPYLGWDESEIQVRESFDPDERPRNAWAAYVRRQDLRAFCQSIRSDGLWVVNSPLIVRWNYFDEETGR